MTIIRKEYDSKLNGPSIMANRTRILLPKQDEISYLPSGEQVVEVPWRYARSKGTNPPYGGYGKPLRPRGPMTPDFFKTFQAAVQDIWAASSMYLMPPGHMLDAIVVASVWRQLSNKEKQKKAEGKRVVNRHNEGRAIDIDSLWWQSTVDGSALSIVVNRYNHTRRLYLATEAIWRIHFGTVLGYPYNEQHHCHWHLDNGTNPGLRKKDFNGSRKHRILFLQEALRYLFYIDPGPSDGKWGIKTANALYGAMNMDGWEGKDEIAEVLLATNLWFDFLKACVKRYGTIVRGLQ